MFRPRRGVQKFVRLRMTLVSTTTCARIVQLSFPRRTSQLRSPSCLGALFFRECRNVRLRHRPLPTDCVGRAISKRPTREAREKGLKVSSRSKRRSGVSQPIYSSSMMSTTQCAAQEWWSKPRCLRGSCDSQQPITALLLNSLGQL